MVIKRAKLSQQVQPSKHAVIARTPPGDEQRVSWRLGDADLGGPYAWSRITEPELARLTQVLREVDKKRWNEVMGDGMGEIKSIPTGNICSDARRRLEDIRRDDESWLCEIRLGNLPRVWGIRDEGVFHILWWDRDHEVCPSELRHT